MQNRAHQHRVWFDFYRDGLYSIDSLSKLYVSCYSDSRLGKDFAFLVVVFCTHHAVSFSCKQDSVYSVDNHNQQCSSDDDAKCCRAGWCCCGCGCFGFMRRRVCAKKHSTPDYGTEVISCTNSGKKDWAIVLLQYFWANSIKWSRQSLFCMHYKYKYSSDYLIHPPF